MGEEEGWIVVAGIAVAVSVVDVVDIVVVVVTDIWIEGLGRKGGRVLRNHVLSCRIIPYHIMAYI